MSQPPQSPPSPPPPPPPPGSESVLPAGSVPAASVPTASARLGSRQRVGLGDSFPVLYRVLVRAQMGRGRILGLGALAVLLLVLAVVIRSTGGADAEAGIVALINDYALGIFLPLAALLFAAPLFSSLIESRLLVYLWLKPIPRWHLAVSALVALFSFVAPVVAISMVATVVIGGATSMAGPVGLAALVGTLAYGSLFLFFGARFRWGIWAGLAYILLIENLMANFGTGRVSIRSYLATIVEWGTDLRVPLGDRAGWAAIVIPLVATVAGLALTGWTLARSDVD